jgi:2-oxoisovalerate dehydrogenase E1 component
METETVHEESVAKSLGLRLFETMSLMRAFERQVGESFAHGEIPGFTHLSIGQEAVAAGVCAALDNRDMLTSTHRGHGHCIARGADPKRVMAEIYGREEGLCRGRGGSMHLYDVARGILGTNGIVAAGGPLACGAALAARTRANGAVVACFAGDGATDEGAMHEAMNLAAVWSLPVIFIIENNGFSEGTPFAFHSSIDAIASRAAGYSMPGRQVDGQDALAVFDAAREAVGRAREGAGPSLIEAITTRFRGHFEGDAMKYIRNNPEAERDPLEVLRVTLTTGCGVKRETLDEASAIAASRVEEALLFARQGNHPEAIGLTELVFAQEGEHPAGVEDSGPGGSSGEAVSESISMRSAITKALIDEMERDPSVIIMGEDVAGGGGMALYEGRGSLGGVFGVTRGLVERFGRTRVLDTPLSETGFVGAAVGAAIAGLRPVVELMFVDFLGTCLDPIYNQGAKVRFMSGGQVKVPMVIRTAYGGGLSAGAQHSGCHYSVFAHFPGIKVVVPSTPADARGLLAAAVRDDNIVVFFEHKALYDTIGVTPTDCLISLGKCDIKRVGTDVTIVGIGKTVLTALDASLSLEKEGIGTEVVDLRSLVPLDIDTILDSVRKTGRLVVVDEDSPNCSVGMEIVARVCECLYGELRAAPRIVSPPSVPVPFAPELESAYLPSTLDVIEAVHLVTGRSL